MQDHANLRNRTIFSKTEAAPGTFHYSINNFHSLAVMQRTPTTMPKIISESSRWGAKQNKSGQRLSVVLTTSSTTQGTTPPTFTGYTVTSTAQSQLTSLLTAARLLLDVETLGQKNSKSSSKITSPSTHPK